MNASGDAIKRAYLKPKADGKAWTRDEALEELKKVDAGPGSHKGRPPARRWVRPNPTPG